MFIRSVYLLLFVLNTFYSVQSGDNMLKEKMEKEEVIPDVIDKVPEEVTEVIYPSGAKVNLGNELTPTQVKDEPVVKWTSDDNAFYTVAMVDPDAPSRKEPKVREVLHWLVGNVRGSDIKSGDVIAEYRGSGPPLNTGLHRYIFLIYKQNNKIEFSEKRIDNRTREGRLNFSIRKFAEKYNLGQPVAGNFYQAQWDEYVPILQSLSKQ
ncbi:protein D3-like isoform X1 [Diorhabda carinulata]|uniref:protein D3-like isoform X1 n=2 Tax=Diorhabda carinulata TaxID=1163345 RepID=UPI0025A310AE|nr:protein D3-like isoform X1 [Diorhabda carinulata]